MKFKCHWSTSIQVLYAHDSRRIANIVSTAYLAFLATIIIILVVDIECMFIETPYTQQTVLRQYTSNTMPLSHKATLLK